MTPARISSTEPSSSTVTACLRSTMSQPDSTMALTNPARRP
jgi:hypothetical protein